MKLNDFRLRTGKPDYPVIVLIHGFGMNGGFWRRPDSCQVFGGLATLSIFLADQPPAEGKTPLAFGRMSKEMIGFASRFVEAGYSVVSWSQREPLGPIRHAVDELGMVMAAVRDNLPGRPVWLVGHSRGGLVARIFLAKQSCLDIVGVITLGTPHGGTELASFARYLQPAGAALHKFLAPRNSDSRLMAALQRVAGFLGSEAIGELQPSSPLLQDLQENLPEEVPFFSFGGTDPALFFLYRRSGDDWKPVPFPEFFLRLIPERKIPPELMAGKGDGLVSAASARLSGSEHANFAVNHVRLAYEPVVCREIFRILKG